ncbi:MAG: metallophosphoesterase [Anaerolineae bacterium]|nr:metallophosphoesterase [Anaerolineae bacterium]
MKCAVWLTDIHLNFLSPVKMEQFYRLVRGTGADSILISGDIGEAPRLVWYLQQLENRLQCPVYFVLGNHDYYHGSFDDVHKAVKQHLNESSYLHWMTTGEIVELAPDVGLIGHDTWADGRCGDFMTSPVMMNDYLIIQDLVGLSKSTLLQKLNTLGDAAAAYFRQILPKVLAQYRHIYCMIHVPPFQNSCWHEGQISDDNFLPHFVCQAVGEVLVEIMQKHPNHQLTVLCGHTHSSGEAQILPNLRVLTGGAEYGKPQIQQLFEFP